MRQPFDDQGNERFTITHDSIHQSPILMKVIFPQVINAVLREIRFGDQSFGNLYPAKGITCELVECFIQQLVDFPVLSLA